MRPSALPRHPAALAHAFRLRIQCPSTEMHLPAVLPGAMQRVNYLSFDYPYAVGALPSSWGSNPSTLPALQILGIGLLRLDGQLPREWAAGYSMLHLLQLHNTYPPPTSGLTAVGSNVNAAATALHLPADWLKRNAFPRLQELELSGLPISGSPPVRGLSSLKSL